MMAQLNTLSLAEEIGADTPQYAPGSMEEMLASTLTSLEQAIPGDAEARLQVVDAAEIVTISRGAMAFAAFQAGGGKQEKTVSTRTGHRFKEHALLNRGQDVLVTDFAADFRFHHDGKPPEHDRIDFLAATSILNRSGMQIAQVTLLSHDNNARWSPIDAAALGQCATIISACLDGAGYATTVPRSLQIRPGE